MAQISDNGLKPVFEIFERSESAHHRNVTGSRSTATSGTSEYSEPFLSDE
jgi:hypothetical protein